MRCVIIDPWEQTVIAPDLPSDRDTGSLIKKLLSRHGEAKFPLAIGLRLQFKDVGLLAYIDDEALFRDDQAFFTMPAFTPHPIGGRAILLGEGHQGEDLPVPPFITAEMVFGHVLWLTREEANAIIAPTLVDGREVARIDLFNPGTVEEHTAKILAALSRKGRP